MAAAVDVVEAAGVRWTGATTREHICAAPCTGGATAGVLSAPSTAAAAPTSQGVQCVCSRGSGDRDPVAAADAVVAAVDPGLSSPGVESRDVVLVTGPWLAGTTSLIDVLRERLPEHTFVEADELGPAHAPAAVVFVVSAIAPLTESDCALVDLAARKHRSGHRRGGEDRRAPQLARGVGGRPGSTRRARAALSARRVGRGRGGTGSGRATARRTGRRAPAAAGRPRCTASKPLARVGSQAEDGIDRYGPTPLEPTVRRG